MPTQPSTCSHLKPRLQRLDNAALVALLCDLYGLNADDKIFLSARFLAASPAELAASYRRIVKQVFNPDGGTLGFPSIVADTDDIGWGFRDALQATSGQADSEESAVVALQGQRKPAQLAWCLSRQAAIRRLFVGREENRLPGLFVVNMNRSDCVSRVASDFRKRQISAMQTFALQVAQRGLLLCSKRCARRTISSRARR